MMFSFFPVYIFIFNLWDRKEKIEQYTEFGVSFVQNFLWDAASVIMLCRDQSWGSYIHNSWLTNESI